jgi:hypothetical protein
MQFHHKQIQRLRTSNPYDWWRQTKELTGQQVKLELQPLIKEVAGSDI